MIAVEAASRSLARRDEGAYCRYVTDEQRSQPECVGRAGRREEASRHAAQFLVQYPNDPHTAAVRRLILH